MSEYKYALSFFLTDMWPSPTQKALDQKIPQGPEGTIFFLQPTFNKGSTSPLAHHPAEVVEEKSYQDMGEVDLLALESRPAAHMDWGYSWEANWG